MTLKHCCLLLFVAALSWAFVGCDSGRTSPVSGVVLLDGQPLANASVQFVPEGTGRDATATTNERGEFAMSTFDPRDGVAPGTYKIVITPPIGEVDTAKYESAADAMAAAAKPKTPAKSTFPQKYTTVSETPLTQVVPIGVPKLKLELQSK